MTHSTRKGAAALLATTMLIVAGCGGPPPAAAPPPVPVFTAQSGYARVSAEFLDAYLAAHPLEATRAGVRTHDARMPAVFAGDLQRRALDVRGALTRLEGMSERTLQGNDRLDYRVLQHAMRAELMDLEEIGAWRRDPGRYEGLVADGSDALVQDRSAPLTERMRSMAARWRAVPLVLRAARQNLEPGLVPTLFAERSLANARSTSAWLADLPASLDAQGAAGVDAALRNEWEAARRTAIASTDSFVVWLERDLAPRATGDFRLGAGRLAELLRLRHHLDIPLEDLFDLNRQAIDEYREWAGRVAMSVDPLRRPADLIGSMTAATRGAAELIPRALAREAAALAALEPRTRVRAVLPAPSLPETWLHYVDQATLGDPALDDASRLAGIRRALHGHALVHTMLALHAGGATLAEAVQNFESIALVDPALARREVLRVAHDPGVGLAAIGRMQLFALRDRLRAERGGSFDARAFEREVIELGLPIPLAAEAILGRDPGVLLVPGLRTPGLPPLPGPLER